MMGWKGEIVKILYVGSVWILHDLVVFSEGRAQNLVKTLARL